MLASIIVYSLMIKVKGQLVSFFKGAIPVGFPPRLGSSKQVLEVGCDNFSLCVHVFKISIKVSSGIDHSTCGVFES